MKVSVVIPNYNGEKLLRVNLPKVFDAVGPSVEVIVVDDGSNDKSLEFLKNQRVKVLKNQKNLGFSTTVNKGVRAAKGEIVILLNTDAYPDAGFLSPLISDFKDSSVFAVGCLEKSFENGKTILRGRGIGRWSRGFLVHSRGEINKNNFTLWASGGSAAFRKVLWQKLGGLNPIYDPFYWEDIDLSYRAMKCGYRIIFEKRSIVYHNHSQGSIKTRYSDFTIRRIAYRNQFSFVWLNITDLFLQLNHVFYLPYHFLRALFNRDLAFFLGFLGAFVMLPKIIRSSLQQQRNFVKSDREILKGFLR